MHQFEDLKIWKKSIELAKEVYKIVADLPKDEKFGLSSQIKRCTVSIASNIAEGAGRNSNTEFRHFLGIANGSCFELQTQLTLTFELQLLEKEKLQPVLELLREIQKMNYALIKRFDKPPLDSKI
ncbi:MAG TPA: four helix bundle protein [Flavobacterium sp.]|jgi:four helix bundle protein